MSRHDDRVSLVDMLNHAEEAVVLLGEASLNDLAEDRVMELALRKLVEIIGEAANRVSEETQHCHQEIPWLQIIGMRNRLVHGYDDIRSGFLTSIGPLQRSSSAFTWSVFHRARRS